MQSHIHIPVQYINDDYLNHAVLLLEKAKIEAAQIETLLENKSETSNAKWYREKLATLFLIITILSSIISFGLGIAGKAISSPDSDPTKELITNIGSYSGYLSIATAFISVYFNISPDIVPFSFKSLCKQFSNDDVDLLSKFASTVLNLSFKTHFTYAGTNITELAREGLDEIHTQLSNLNSANIQITKKCLAKMTTISNNLYTLFNVTQKTFDIADIKNNIQDNIEETIPLLDDQNILSASLNLNQ
jgi:hypothetical protein